MYIYLFSKKARLAQRRRRRRRARRASTRPRHRHIVDNDNHARPAHNSHRYVFQSAARATLALRSEYPPPNSRETYPSIRTCSPSTTSDMDIYSLSFTHPRRSRHLHPPTSLDAHDHRLPPHIQQHLPENFPSSLPLPAAQPSPPNQADSETVEKLAILARSLHNIQLSYLLSDGGRSWNFYISGAYQQVMLTRGMLLKDSPVQVSPLSRHFLQPLLLTPHAASHRHQGAPLRHS